tara:strand:+ start:731 stop:1501 length:771 start_codon:yes stop_codon:yes gene_type:complete
MNKLQDENLQFDEPTHVYSLKNAPETEFTSATTFIHRFFEPFDREKIATKLLNLPKYQGKTREDLFQDWKQSGISGTNIHAALENVILDHMSRSEDYNFPKSCENNVEKYCVSSVERKKAENGIEWLKNNLLFEDYLEPIPEAMIYSKELKIAGMMDLLVKNTETGNYTILDWKTNKRIYKNSFGGSMGALGATDDIEDCNFMHYTLQLSLYRYILETYYGLNISSQAIIHLSEDRATVMSCDYYKDNIERMLKEI